VPSQGQANGAREGDQDNTQSLPATEKGGNR